MMEVMPDIRLIDCAVHFGDLVPLADSAFGEGYLREHDFLVPGSLVLGAFVDSVFVAFLLARIVNDPYVHDSTNSMFPELAYPFVHIKSVAVLPHWRLKGVATALLSHCLGLCRGLGIVRFMAVLWQKDDLVPASTLFLRQGFSIVKQLPRFWYSHSMEHQYLCGVCGSPPCCCDGVLYGLTLP
jgi:GNAT superfamily N-acetyltransferase